MSRATQPAPIEAEVVYPEFNPSPGYRGFIERLRRARLDRGLSIADMSDEVELHFKLAYEFETCAAPLPFDYLEVWCQVVGVPFEDFLAIYWADQREWQERQDAQEAAQNAPAPTSVDRCFSYLANLRAAFERTFGFFHSRFFTASQKP